MTIADDASVRPPTRDDDCGCGGSDPGRPAAASPMASGSGSAGAYGVPEAPRPGRSAPRPLERNAFFPRKLMEVRHWQAEQDYHRRARELHTRLATGCGVLCGLDVFATEAGTVVIRAGVAVDGGGREIVVPHDLEVDPARLTDACGSATGRRLDQGTVTISVCYHECGIDPVAIPAEWCDDERRCVPGMIRESFSISVTVGAPAADDDLCGAFWGRDPGEQPRTEPGTGAGGAEASDDGAESGEERPLGEEPAATGRRPTLADRRAALDRRAPRTCDCGCDGPCVPLATVVLAAERPPQVDLRVRTVIRSNRELLELILCLAERLEECCGRPAPTPAPRITDMFPWPAADPAAVIAALARTGAVEIAFDRPMAEADLDDPAAWLGLWVVGEQEAGRIVLVRDPGAPPTRVAVPPGGSAAVFRFARGDGAMTHSRGSAAIPAIERPLAVVVMVRSGGGGIIRGGGSAAPALDAERHATHLDATQRGELWTILPGAKAAFGGAAQAVPTAGIPALPTGDGDAEGELHIVLPVTPDREPDPDPDPDPEPEPDREPPRLLAVLPTGISARARRPQDARSLDLTLSAPVVDAAVAEPRAWVRAWEGSFDNGVFDLVEAELEPGAAEEQADGSVVCRFPLHVRGDGVLRSVVVVVWPDQAPAGVAPIGTDAAGVLLDADWIATTLDEETLKRLWDGDLFPNGLPDPRPAVVPKPPLWDGAPGGIAHWTFFAQND